MLVFSDVKTDLGIQRVASYCPESPDFAQLVNSTVRRLMRRGDWPGTLQPLYLCVCAGCVVFPRYVQNIRALGICGSAVKAQNMWGSYLDRSFGAPWRMGLRWWGGGSDASPMMISQGRSSVYQDVQGDGRLLRAYYRCNVDLGKTLRIFGTDNNGQALQTIDPITGEARMGLSLTLAAPWASTSVYVRSIDYVLLDEMQCPVNLFAYNASTNLMEDIAQYEPGDSRPSFEKVRLSVPGLMPASCASNSCCATQGVTALAKLKFIASKYDDDLVLIDNLDALKLGIQSQKFAEAGDRNNAKAYEADAIQELNRQLEDENPDSQFVASNAVFGPGVGLANHCF